MPLHDAVGINCKRGATNLYSQFSFHEMFFNNFCGGCVLIHGSVSLEASLTSSCKF